MRSRRLANRFGLPEPLRVRTRLVLDHSRKRIYFVGKPAYHRNLRYQMNEGQKRSAPGFHEYHSTIFSQGALHFGKGLLQIAGQIWQMMQTALHDEYIFAAFRKRKFPAIGNDAFREAFVLRNKPGREVYPFEVCESQPLQRD